MDLEIPVPHLKTVHSGPLHPIEALLLDNVAAIEAWFRNQWAKTKPIITSSVDLRHSGLKLAPVDTNLFPAGFNNINPDFLPLCIQAAQSVLVNYLPSCTKILLIPETHTRNTFYAKSLSVLLDILQKAGFVVRLGHMEPHDTTLSIPLSDNEALMLYPVIRQDDKLALKDFSPCIIMLNNDLSAGVPDILKGLKQTVMPPSHLGWDTRLKSGHFKHYDDVAKDFANLLGFDDWLINPYFTAVSDVDFMAMQGLEPLAAAVDTILAKIRAKYERYGITEKPFVVVKADNGTYGMSVMSVYDGQEILALNRKSRTKMSASKGQQTVHRVLVQEGVYTFETMDDGAVAEPVVYMIGQYVIGGFYRVHKSRGKAENLNAPGMHFEPLAFVEPCNMPRHELDAGACQNRFYAYGVIARLAALAAAREQ